MERGGDAEDAWFIGLFVKTFNTAAQALFRKMGYPALSRGLWTITAPLLMPLTCAGLWGVTVRISTCGKTEKT